ncbi:MAG: histidinol phosphatase [Chloroflexi bacterium]|nr:histidinol phosphatase [Chloroflexota bacterium]HEV8053946.1 inositol monophosphatase family protein [Candidatus Limnocylindrales bacterium]
MESPASFGPDWSAGFRRGSSAELEGWLELALACCDAADALAMRSFRRDVPTARKPDRTFVTEADKAIEARIRELISARHPGHGLIGEEYGEDAPDAPVRWYIDPIDGTHNFMRGVPLFGTLLAVERGGELQVGVLSAPALRERWYAWRGGGAWASGSAGMAPGATRRLTVSTVGDVADSQILYSSPDDLEASGRAGGFRDLIRAAWRDRGFGDFWGYALVAEGAAEAMIEVGVESWDLAAPIVLIEEAGGRLTDLDGRRVIDARSVLASNGHLHDTVLNRLAQTP